MRRAHACDIDLLLGTRSAKTSQATQTKRAAAWWHRRTYLASFPITRLMMMNNGSADRAGESAGRWAARNLNTILISVVLFVLTAGGGALAKISYTNALTLAEMKGSLVTKQELDLRIAAIKADLDVKISSLDKDLTALKLALAERGIGQKQR